MTKDDYISKYPNGLKDAAFLAAGVSAHTVAQNYTEWQAAARYFAEGNGYKLATSTAVVTISKQARAPRKVNANAIHSDNDMWARILAVGAVKVDMDALKTADPTLYKSIMTDDRYSYDGTPAAQSIKVEHTGK